MIHIQSTHTPSASTVHPSGLSSAAIDEYAGRVAAHYGLHDTSYHADVHHLVHTLGGTIEQHVIILHPTALTVYAPRDFVIHLPAVSSHRRNRFQILHNLGHYFLHYLLPEQTGYATFQHGGDGAVEVEANRFASALIMPSQQFANAVKQYDDVWDIADAFGVSPQAVEHRARILSIAI